MEQVPLSNTYELLNVAFNNKFNDDISRLKPRQFEIFW